MLYGARLFEVLLIKKCFMKVAVIGSGVVGEATGRGLIRRGHKVKFIDIKRETVERLKQEGLSAFTWEDLGAKSVDDDAVVFTVSTPTEKGKINLEYLKAAAVAAGRRMVGVDNYQVIVVRSTVSPGTTEEVAKVVEEQSGRKSGKDFGVSMNPEYLREVSAVDDFDNPWMITIGQLDQRSGDMVAKLYEGFKCPVERVSVKEAEMQKYVHNLYNAVKITYFNEMREVCERLGIDANNIFRITAVSAEGMWNVAYGTKDRGPYSGMCLPKDTQAFFYWAKKKGWKTALLRTTIDVNNGLIKRKRAEDKIKIGERMLRLIPGITRGRS